MIAKMFDGVNIAARALDYHLSRHNVLATNVANAETPGFRPFELVREVEPSAEGGAPGGTLPLQATDAKHLPLANGGDGNRLERLEEQVVQPRADGNSVNMEREMMKVAANDLRFTTISRMVKNNLATLGYAASDAGRG